MSLIAVASQAQAEWNKVFPKQPTETYTASVSFIKQLTTVAVSTITYLKNMFSEESYNVESFGGIRIRILKTKCRDELAQFVSTALVHAFEAFEKKYLHKLALCFYEGGSCNLNPCNAEDLLEYHIFEFSYNDDGVTMDLTSKNMDAVMQSTKYTFDRVREQTVKLIRSSLVMMETCQNQLPPTYDVSVRLYYNDAAPDGYQAPGFLSSLERSDHLEETENSIIKVGSVHTPFHRFVASSYMRDLMHSSHDAEPSQNTPMMTQNDDIDVERSAGERSPGTGGNGAPRIRCACQKNDDDGGFMFICDYCGNAQHAACCGRLAAVQQAGYCCTHCFDALPSRTGADLKLARLTHKKRECLCILRRTLQWCTTLPAVGVDELVQKFRLSLVNAIKLIKLLQSNGAVEDTDIDIMLPRKIIPEQLSAVMSKYFYPEETDFVDRLLAETLSQGAKSGLSDPVGDVLGPMEKFTLQNATTLGKIIEPPPQSVTEDPTLQQYKEAILSNQQTDEELPLTGNHNVIKDMMTANKNGKRKAGKENVRTGAKTKRAKANPK